MSYVFTSGMYGYYRCPCVIPRHYVDSSKVYDVTRILCNHVCVNWHLTACMCRLICHNSLNKIVQFFCKDVVFKAWPSPHKFSVTASRVCLMTCTSVHIIPYRQFTLWCSHLLLADSVRRQSNCELEVDVLAEDILNRHQVNGEVHYC